VFNWFKRKKETPVSAQEAKIHWQNQSSAQPQNKFEIFLPENLQKEGSHDLQIASKFLSLLAESNLESQKLEIFSEMRLVSTPSNAIKNFLTTVNGAKQLDNFVHQVEKMLFPGTLSGSKGVLCCLVNGNFTMFEITEVKGKATIAWQIVRSERNAT
jgi:hypothetical protein